MVRAIGLALIMVGVMMADSDRWIAPILVTAVGIFLLRKEIA